MAFCSAMASMSPCEFRRKRHRVASSSPRVSMSKSRTNSILPLLTMARCASKNIEDPVRVFQVKQTPDEKRWLSITKRWRRAALYAAAAMLVVAAVASWYWYPQLKSVATQMFVEPRPQPSIAVLPLNNLSGTTDQEYFSDGLTNDITTDLSKFLSLFVVAANSAFTYKGKPSKAQDIGRDLGVRYFWKGLFSAKRKNPDQHPANRYRKRASYLG